MNYMNAARCGFIALALLAASCTPSTPPTGPATSDDNGANCGGTAANQQNCINNQNRMNKDAANPDRVRRAAGRTRRLVSPGARPLLWGRAFLLVRPADPGSAAHQSPAAVRRSARKRASLRRASIHFPNRRRS